MFQIYNSFKHKKECFTPSDKARVKIYSCGPTVYSRMTIGNLRSFVFSDLLRRSLEYSGLKVKIIMNITDVGHLTMTEEQKRKFKDIEITDTDAGVDRMEKAALKENKTVWEVAEGYIKMFFEDIEKLNIKKADHYPRATEHIKEQIEMIKQLIDKGYAYVTKTAVFFDTSKFLGYEKISGQQLDEKAIAVREEVEKDSTKKHPADFRLWQLNQPEHSMQWESPWGKGFPGWHIECSAMSVKYLGQPIDIHTGGIDHIPVHHPNEIAQTEAATGKRFVNYWMHGGFLVVNGKRMGKSLNNAFTIADIEANGFDGIDLRYLFLNTHYRQTLNFTWDSLASVSIRLRKLREKVAEWSAISNRNLTVNKGFRQKFILALEDDLNLPKALAVLSAVLESDLAVEEKLGTLKDFDLVLGLDLFKGLSTQKMNPLKQQKIEKLIKKREDLRNHKQWEEADAIRKQLMEEFNVEIDDTAEGTKWKKMI